MSPLLPEAGSPGWGMKREGALAARRLIERLVRGRATKAGGLHEGQVINPSKSRLLTRLVDSHLLRRSQYSERLHLQAEPVLYPTWRTSKAAGTQSREAALEAEAEQHRQQQELEALRQKAAEERRQRERKALRESRSSQPDRSERRKTMLSRATAPSHQSRRFRILVYLASTVHCYRRFQPVPGAKLPAVKRNSNRKPNSRRDSTTTRH